MSQQISLKEAERKVFRFSYNDGLWDIFLGCFLLIFVIAPYLSTRLGDFWNSMIFLPFWAIVYLAVWLLRKYVVKPRIGTVRIGQVRKKKLAKFTVVMLGINLISLILGVVVFINYRNTPGLMISVIFGLIMLMGFSFAASMLDFNRLYIYGLLVGISPLVGEWLWTHGYATHHGIPITFGIVASIMVLVGTVIFIGLLRSNPLPKDGSS